MSVTPLRFAMTPSSLRAMVAALVAEATAAGLPVGAALCNVEHANGTLLRAPDAQFLPLIPWQPHWGPVSAYRDHETPEDLLTALRGLPVNIGRDSWAIYLTKSEAPSNG